MINNFALIIGGMRCGTTSLFSYLSQHPQIATPRFKEPNFFSHDERWNKGFEWYSSNWENWNDRQHKIALEASITYTKLHAFPQAIERIDSLKDRVNFKFIYLLRNPIDRIESHYSWTLSSKYRNNNKYTQLSEGVEPDFIETSKYAQQIDEYYKRFPADSILLLNFEDFKTEPLKIVRQVCQFLEVDPDYAFQGLGKTHNSTQGRIVDVPWWIEMRKIKPLKSIGQLISKEQKKKLRFLVGGRQLNNKIDNFKLSYEQKKLVLSELEEDLRRLKIEYAVDISRWKIEV